jgi:hypothetical protein
VWLVGSLEGRRSRTSYCHCIVPVCSRPIVIVSGRYLLHSGNAWIAAMLAPNEVSAYKILWQPESSKLPARLKSSSI